MKSMFRQGDGQTMTWRQTWDYGVGSKVAAAQAA